MHIPAKKPGDVQFPSVQLLSVEDIGPNDLRVPLPGDVVATILPTDVDVQLNNQTVTVAAGSSILKPINGCGLARWIADPSGGFWMFLCEIDDALFWIVQGAEFSWSVLQPFEPDLSELDASLGQAP